MYNERKFRVIYDEYLSSGLTIKDYCANQLINEARFYYWQKKLKGQLPPKRGFVPLVIENSQYHRPNQFPLRKQPESFSKNSDVRQPESCCEINYPNGVSVKLNALPDIQVLESLLLLVHR